MNREQIKHITNDHYRKLKKYAKTIAAGFDVEAIHEFRVVYKKLRAFLRMVSALPKAAAEIKISKKLKKAYTISGAIRDLQLQQQRVLEASTNERKKTAAYLSLLHKEIEKLKPELSEILGDSPVAECKKRTDAAIPEKFPFTVFRDFVQQKWTVVYSIIISRHFSDDNIHTIRKTLKDLLYNLRTYEGVQFDILSYSIWKGKGERYFDELLDELGGFQDKCIAIALLKAYWLNSLNTSSRQTLERIKKQWIKDKSLMKRLLVNKLKTGIALPKAAG